MNKNPDVRKQAKASVWNLLVYIGENPIREGLKETPERVVKAYQELFRGYDQKPEEVLKTTFAEETYDEMVILKDIEFYSTCEHHMLPFYGRAHIGYIPNKKLVGISKLARIVDVYARRLQIQERMTNQIADAIMTSLEPQGVMVVVEGIHLCMVSRGVSKQNSVMTTNSIKGAFVKPETRLEFMEAIKQ